MKRACTAMMVAALMVCQVGLVWAQGPAPEVGVDARGEEPLVKAVTTYDYDDDLVEGQILKPGGTVIDSRLKDQLKSLVEVRANFVPEMIISTDDL